MMDGHYFYLEYVVCFFISAANIQVHFSSTLINMHIWVFTQINFPKTQLKLIWLGNKKQKNLSIPNNQNVMGTDFLSLCRPQFSLAWSG